MLLAVGLTGPVACGKGTVANVLDALARQNGIEVVRTSLSDQIRKERARRGQQGDRNALKETANWFRIHYGSGALAILATADAKNEIDKSFSGIRDRNILVIVDAIRNPGEVYELRNRFGHSFKLIGIQAPLEIIRENLRRRQREDESQQALENGEVLQDLVATEMGAGESVFGHNVAECLNMADYPLIDNNGTLEELKEKASILYDHYLLPTFVKP